MSRRRALHVAGLGVSSLTLPSALAAASTLGPTAQSSLPAYGGLIVGSTTSATSDTVLAHWDTFDAGAVDWEGSAPWVEATIRDAEARPDRAAVAATPQFHINTSSAAYAGTDVASPAAGRFSDVSGTGTGTVESPYYTEFVFNTPGTTLSLSESPFVEWRIALSSIAYQMRVQSLVLCRVRRLGTNPVSLAFYASRDGFASATVLLRTATPGTGLSLISVSTEQVAVVGTAGLRVRMYPYAMTGPETVRFRTYGYTGGVTPLDPTRGSTDTPYQGTTGTFPVALAAFVGQVLPSSAPPA